MEVFRHGATVTPVLREPVDVYSDRAQKRRYGQEGYATVLEGADQMADLVHGDRVDPGEGLVKQQVFRISSKAAGNLDEQTGEEIAVRLDVAELGIRGSLKTKKEHPAKLFGRLFFLARKSIKCFSMLNYIEAMQGAPNKNTQTLVRKVFPQIAILSLISILYLCSNFGWIPSPIQRRRASRP